MRSNKKVLGTVGCIVVYVIGLIAVIKEPTTVGVVLAAIVSLVIALFGIKAASGTILQIKGRDGRQGETL